MWVNGGPLEIQCLRNVWPLLLDTAGCPIVPGPVPWEKVEREPYLFFTRLLDIRCLFSRRILLFLSESSFGQLVFAHHVIAESRYLGIFWPSCYALAEYIFSKGMIRMDGRFCFN
ncbi:hypothetical protein AVEN_39738-1 [Araneus ventricosus]|uniref:Uncharacterized protein n=1 Tax=Araneus ventricosus TaxID=182803 RepID=A0A4Y2RA39_ARAVE|nr:hypothetical protein AVEN_243312-1 [Araneus ventricosus]GBN72639.1 hypothetical protein AVEN_80759-1 [Araneus ventricosus]GBN89203.1 hypothetical protein AVEN_70695-1 [Araneus ventricosus]GBN89252.1 hypothetical protein AVEN_39738-1 [Araneus ventricosus]